MKISDAIRRLEQIQKKYGDDVGVLFDCPHCKLAFPLGVATVAVVFEPASAKAAI